MLIIKNETGFKVELNEGEDVKSKRIFLENEVMEFESESDFCRTSQVIVYNESDCKVYISNGYTDSNVIKQVEIYID
jgi:hypothetical protein